MTTPIRYTTGDATHPEGEGDRPIIIAHIVNDVGAWGAGFVLAISKRWPSTRSRYLMFHRNGMRRLRATQFMPVEPLVVVANMCAQHGVGRDLDGKPPIRYDALHDCLSDVGDRAIDEGAEVHMPRIGCGLAGGTWEIVEPIIQETLADRGVQVVVYDYQARP